MSLLIKDARAVLAFGIVDLLLRVACSAVFIFVLLRVLRLETKR